MLIILFTISIVFLVSYFGVEVFRRWSVKREIIDFPNERSSHTIPTPRGGGLIIFVVSILSFLIYSVTSGEQVYWSFFIGAAIVAIISLIDDIKPISPLLRFLFHALAAGLVIWDFGGFHELYIPFYGIIQIGLIGDLLTFLGIIWLINAYNFMDGIDGIASVQALTAGCGWSLMGFYLNSDITVMYGAFVAASSAGFLLHNWQPARIFMGDVGSAFLGFSFAVLPLMAHKTINNQIFSANLPWIALFFMWFFVFDSAYTFLKRLFRKEKVWQPHREHIYQKLVIAGLSHALVSGIYGLCSAILVSVIISSLYFSFNFYLTVIFIILVETALLILYKNKTIR